MFRTVLAAFITCLVVGCAVERPLDSGEELEPVQEYTPEGYDTHLLNGRVGGDFDIGYFDQQEATHDEWVNSTGDTTDFSLLLSESGRAAMGWFVVEGGLDHSDLTPGFSAKFDHDDFVALNGLRFYGYTCSGPQAYNWQYDDNFESLSVSVEATDEPGIDRLLLVGEDRKGHLVSGSIDMAR